MILKSKKNTSFKLPPKKTRKPRTKKGEKNANLLPEAESLLDKLNRKTLVDRLNATNSKLQEIGLESDDESNEKSKDTCENKSDQEDLNLKLTDTLEIDSNHSKSSESMQISINSSNEWVKPNEKSIDEEDETINPENLLSSTKMPSPQAKKSVRIRKKFSEVKIFSSLLDLDCFVRESNEFSIVTTHSNNVNCTQCTTNDKEHKMSVIYRKCKCNKKECSLSYKLTNCKKGLNWILYQNGSHPLKRNNDVNASLDMSINQSKTVRVNSKQKPREKRGVALKVIDLYNKWLMKDSSLTGQKLLSKLIQRRRSNMKKKPDDQDSRLCFSKNLIPSLPQV